jgi:hypothetical protein
MRDRDTTAANGVSAAEDAAKSYVNRGFYTDLSDSDDVPQTVVSDISKDVTKTNRPVDKSTSERFTRQSKHQNCTSTIDDDAGDKMSTVRSIFPFLAILRNYSVRNDLMSDVMAGLIVGIMHIPQGKYSLTKLMLKIKTLNSTDYSISAN